MIPDVAANRGKKQHRHLARESKYPEQRRRTRQLVHQPKLRGSLHPRANQRNELSRDEQLKVAVLHGAKARGHGRVDRCAVTFQIILPPLVGYSA